MTAADQPTTEPSAEVLNAFYAAVRRSCPVDLGYDDTRALARDLAETAASLLTPAPQPAADTETEVQWGVRRLDGMVAPYGRKNDALRRIAAMGGTLVSIREEA